MEILRKNFKKIDEDNNEVFISHLIGIIQSVDELSSVELVNDKDVILVRIAPSMAIYINLLIEQLLQFFNLFKMKVEMSKSIKTTNKIVFNIKKQQ